MPKILISYRRSDTAGVAGRIFDRLVARFGHESIFMDVDHIPFGIDFRDHIRETLLAGDMLLAIVGHRWLGPREGARARMHDDNDPVRVEIETALQNGVTLIPVLVDGAPMPAPDELPSALEKFSYPERRAGRHRPRFPSAHGSADPDHRADPGEQGRERASGTRGYGGTRCDIHARAGR